MELEIGIVRIERPDVKQSMQLRAWMDRYVLPEFLARTLPVDSTVVVRCAPLPVPAPRPERDALIAATAIVHGMTVVRRNLVDFRIAGARAINPRPEHHADCQADCLRLGRTRYAHRIYARLPTCSRFGRPFSSGAHGPVPVGGPVDYQVTYGPCLLSAGGPSLATVDCAPQ